MKDILKDYKDMLEGLGSILDDEEIITGNLVEEQIEKWLRENCKIIGDYKIFQEDNNYYVDINDFIIITNKEIERFPIELFYFNNINGIFDCSDCKSLISLEGGPRRVGGNFYCSRCDSLTSFKGAPKEIGDSFYCTGCSKLKTLKGASEKVAGDFKCNYCKNLNSLRGLSPIIKRNLYINGCNKLLNKYPDIEAEARKYSKIRGVVYIK